MSILIADSGSTKTDWVLLDNSKVVLESQTIGFSPYFQSTEDIISELETNLLPSLKPFFSDINTVMYYGTGCSNEDNKKILKDAFQSIFGNIEIEINHDLLASARALCVREKGIACILGTGSNSCLYDGENIIENVASYGYLFGDHGSGANIGKAFIQSYFDGQLPSHLSQAFESKGYNREVILNHVYKQPMPNKYLAGIISQFISHYNQDIFIKQLIKNCFSEFFNFQISKYTDSKLYPVHFVGSIAFYYQELLKEVTEEKEYQMGRVIKSPIQGLIQYHQ